MIPALNQWSGQALQFGWSVLWQSSLLIIILLAIDLLLGRRLRPVVRYALWLVVLVKIILPPSLAFPTGAGWWLRPKAELPPTVSVPVQVFGGSYPSLVEFPPASAAVPLPPQRPPASASLSMASWAMLGWASVSLLLLGWMLFAWGRLAQKLRRASPAPPSLDELLSEVRSLAGRRSPVRLVLTEEPLSPAVFGLSRPTIVLPAALAMRLPASQLRLVLLHELFHLRNRDVWVNCIQGLLQIVYWWHPLLWLANARIRRVREETVDDAVMRTQGDDNNNYALTLLEVARQAIERPIAALGLVGILESKRHLRQRIERLLSVAAPRQAGLTAFSVLGIAAFTAVALPMGQAPARVGKPSAHGSTALQQLKQAVVVENRNTSINKPPADAIKSSLTWQAEALTAEGALEFNTETGVLTASKGVRVTFGGTELTADKVSVDEQTRQLTAEGSVRLKQGDRVVTAEKLSTSVNSMGEYAQASSPPAPVATTSLGTNTIRRYPPRQAIYNKLNNIRLETVQFNDLPLGQVLETLNAESRLRDPDGTGVNFILGPVLQTPQSMMDPATGLPATPAPVEPGIDSVRIRLLLQDVRLADVLDAMTKVADRGIKYTVEDYGVVFRPRVANEPTPLFMRTIKVDPNTFIQGLNSFTGFQAGVAPKIDRSVPLDVAAPLPTTPPGNAAVPSNFFSNLREFFLTAGVDMTPPKSAYFNHTEGTLLVRATLPDLDKIESLVSALNQPEPKAGSPSASTNAPVETRYFEVWGEVQQPGRFVYREGITITEAIKAAGGFTAKASKNMVELCHSHARVQTVDVRMIEAGYLNNIVIRPNDEVLVKEGK